MKKDAPLRVEIENGELVIRVGILRLDGHEYHNEIPALTFTDLERWAKDVITEMTREEEDGQTPLNMMLDNAMKAALENGSVGVDYDKPTFVGECPICENDIVPLRHTKNGIRCGNYI
jgi:hypothetical protein